MLVSLYLLRIQESPVQKLLFSRFLSANIQINIYVTIILAFDLYGFEAWSVTFREEHRLKVFENRVMSNTFGPKREGVIVDWRKLHGEELHDLYCSSDIILEIKTRSMGWAGHVPRLGRR